jgi:hypothetical protein
MRRIPLLPAILLLTSCALSKGALYPEVSTTLHFISATDQVVDKYSVPGETHVQYIEPLKKYALEKLSVPVTDWEGLKAEGIAEIGVGPGYIGLTACTVDVKCAVFLDASASGNTRLYTLLHELAHVKMADKPNTEEVNEIVAETTAWRAAKGIRFPVEREYASYILRYPEWLRYSAINGWEGKIKAWSEEFVAAMKGV